MTLSEQMQTKLDRELARRQHGELAEMRSVLERVFGIRITLDRLEQAEQLRLLELHKKAYDHEEWWAHGRNHYAVESKFNKKERHDWRRLVGKGASGDEGLLDRLDEDIEATKQIAALARRAATPLPSNDSAVIPAAAWTDVLKGRLLASDLSPLLAFVLMFRTAKLDPEAERVRRAEWADDGTTIVVRGEWTSVLPLGWGDSHAVGVDAIAYHRQTIGERLTGAGWLSIERRGPNVTVVRLGERLRQTSRPAKAKAPAAS